MQKDTSKLNITHFRGRTSSGRWVYGDLMHYKDGSYAIMPNGGWERYGSESTDCHRREKVLKETIGQFIGWYDSKGTPLYVDDHIQLHWNNKILTIYNDHGLITFKDDRETFYPHHINRDGLSLKVTSLGYRGEIELKRIKEEIQMHQVSSILCQCSVHTKLFSPLVGECYLESVDNDMIKVKFNDRYSYIFDLDGRMPYAHTNGECMLFPNRWVRSWDNVCVENGELKFNNENDD